MKKKFVKPVVKKVKMDPCLILSSSGSNPNAIDKGTGTRPNTAQARKATEVIVDYDY